MSDTTTVTAEASASDEFEHEPVPRSHRKSPEFSDAIVGLIAGGLAYVALESFAPKKEIIR